MRSPPVAKPGSCSYSKPDRTKLARLFKLVHKGVLRPIIDSRFMEINDAMDRFAESGKQGRVLLDLTR